MRPVGGEISWPKLRCISLSRAVLLYNCSMVPLYHRNTALSYLTSVPIRLYNHYPLAVVKGCKRIFGCQIEKLKPDQKKLSTLYNGKWAQYSDTLWWDMSGVRRCSPTSWCYHRTAVVLVVLRCDVYDGTMICLYSGTMYWVTAVTTVYGTILVHSLF